LSEHLEGLGFSAGLLSDRLSLKYFSLIDENLIVVAA